MSALGCRRDSAFCNTSQKLSAAESRRGRRLPSCRCHRRLSSMQELGMQYAETSAKEAQDVEEPFKLIAAAIKRVFDQSGEGMPGEEY